MDEQVAGMQVPCRAVSARQPAVVLDSDRQSSTGLHESIIVERFKVD
ncbi:hypothetical protein [Burkholderia cepacia]|nr:hypothetical protein [Burkholderia cepacia]MDN7896464.1 hypothetical protein [Burkholderia cepacia]